MKTRRAHAEQQRRPVEWVGGIAAMPAYVGEEGGRYRPEVLLWIGADGSVLGSRLGKPGELVGAASDSLREAIEHPLWGRPHQPAAVRVASPALAAALRDGHPDVAVRCAPTPEIDAVLGAMREKLSEEGEPDESYLAGGADPQAVGAFFRAAAALYRAQPWQIVPNDQNLLSVSIEQLGVMDAALSVIGQSGESFGLILFSGIAEFEAFLDVAEAIERGEEPALPPHTALNFERGADISPLLRKEIAAHGWEVADASAYPWLAVVEDGPLARLPTARELTIAEAIALALPQVLSETTALATAWEGGETLVRTVLVQTHGGDVKVTLGAPYEANAPEQDELVRKFADSPEAQGLSDLQSCRFVMDLAAQYFDATIATLRPSELREIIFDLIPRKVSIEASAAADIIAENRAFFAFLKRELGLEQADACLAVLGSDAVKRLEAALSDPSKFGMAKSMVMAGREAGFDISTREGIEAWMCASQGKPLPASMRLPPQPEPPRTIDEATRRARKKQRKAARHARKKNR